MPRGPGLSLPVLRDFKQVQPRVGGRSHGDRRPQSQHTAAGRKGGCRCSRRGRACASAGGGLDDDVSEPDLQLCQRGAVPTVPAASVYAAAAAAAAAHSITAAAANATAIS